MSQWVTSSLLITPFTFVFFAIRLFSFLHFSSLFFRLNMCCCLTSFLVVFYYNYTHKKVFAMQISILPWIWRPLRNSQIFFVQVRLSRVVSVLHSPQELIGCMCCIIHTIHWCFYLHFYCMSHPYGEWEITLNTPPSFFMANHSCEIARTNQVECTCKLALNCIPWGHRGSALLLYCVNVLLIICFIERTFQIL